MVGIRIRSRLRVRRAGAVATSFALAAALNIAAVPARAADWLGDTPLRGALSGAGVGWDGVYIGGSIAYSRMNADFSDVSSTLSDYGLTISNQTGQVNSYGGFIGYNSTWEWPLVLGIEGGYNHLSSSLTVSDSDQVTSGSVTYDGSSSITLKDYGTLRGRVGYSIGQFLPYAALGVAVGRFSYKSYATSTSGGTTTVLLNDTNDNAFGIGFDAGVGIDVALASNVFLRGEYDYIIFGRLGSIRTQLSTARAGIAVRF